MICVRTIKKVYISFVREITHTFPNKITHLAEVLLFLFELVTEIIYEW